ncbi:MAG: exosortase-associated EpsI family protein [Candidatus Altarchaeaceae archaeon]
MHKIFKMQNKEGIGLTDESNNYNTTNKDGLILVALVFAAVVVYVTMLSSIDDIMYSKTTIDTTFYHKSQNEMRMYSVFKFYNESSFKNFPASIGRWKGHEIYIKKNVFDALKPDIMFARIYEDTQSKGKFVELLFISTKSETNLYDPNDCYRTFGWEIERSEIATIYVNSSLLKPLNASREAPYYSPYEVHVNCIVVTKENNSMVVMWWYMWEGVTRSKEKGVFIRLSMPVHANESDEEVISYMKEFLTDLFPILYSSRAKSDIIALEIVKSFGIFGIFADILLFIVPLIAIFLQYKRIKYKGK